jgi:hypothetical protein
MDQSKRCTDVLPLGKKIVDELGIDDGVDTLARWMAHYTAEKILLAETATDSDREVKQAACCEQILKLWGHRNTMPLHRRPFDSFAPLFKVLNSLDSDSTSQRYFLDFASDDESEETNDWLNYARQIDEAARTIIRYCVANAAEKALNQESDWVAAARQAVAITDDDLRLINMLAEISGSQNVQTAAEAKTAQLNDLIVKAGQLTSLLEKFAADWRKEIQTNVNQ